MVEANIKIIEDLKMVLDLFKTDNELRSLVTNGEFDFSRNRKLPFERTVGIILNMPKRSLSIEIQDFFDHLESGVNTCTKGAFSLQRSKLKALFFTIWNKQLVNSFYSHYGESTKKWKGFILQAVDGSTAYLINKKEVIDHYGTQGNQHVSVPMAQIVQIQDVLNDLTVWGNISPIKDSEMSIINNNIRHFRKDSLTLFDRGFPSFTLMHLLLNEEKPLHFLMRCRKNFNREVIEFLKSNKTSEIISFSPTAEALETLKNLGHIVTRKQIIKVRVVKVKLSTGEDEILLTNLFDEELYTLADLKQLYALRWGIETAFGKQKNQQQMEQFSGHKVISIQQDYAATLIIANLQSLIEKQSEDNLRVINTNRKHDYKINKNISWHHLKHNVVKLFLENDPKQILIKLQYAFEQNLEPIRPNRSYTRDRKSKRVNGKYQTLTNYKRAI
jgi:hypothetical protein